MEIVDLAAAVRRAFELPRDHQPLGSPCLFFFFVCFWVASKNIHIPLIGVIISNLYNPF